MTATRPAKQPIRFALPDQVPDLVRAASLGLAVARHCKASSWSEFVARASAHDEDTLLLLADLDVDADDWALVTRPDVDGVLRHLTIRPLVTVAVCPDCNKWVLVAGTPPTKCRVTLRCQGKPVKASIAAKAKPVVDGP